MKYNNDAGNVVLAAPRTTSVLVRLVVQSHHIIARFKRRMISNAARELDLGGYAWVGWPGMMLIKEDGRHCDTFWEDIYRLC